MAADRTDCVLCPSRGACLTISSSTPLAGITVTAFPPGNPTRIPEANILHGDPLRTGPQGRVRLGTFRATGVREQGARRRPRPMPSSPPARSVRGTPGPPLKLCLAVSEVPDKSARRWSSPCGLGETPWRPHSVFCVSE